MEHAKLFTDNSQVLLYNNPVRKVNTIISKGVAEMKRIKNFKVRQLESVLPPNQLEIISAGAKYLLLMQRLFPTDQGEGT